MEHSNTSRIVFFLLIKTLQTGPDNSLCEYSHATIGKFEHPHDKSDSPDIEDILPLRILDLHILLSDQEDHPVRR